MHEHMGNILEGFEVFRFKIIESEYLCQAHLESRFYYKINY
ncbi:hypothetical protein ES708_25887 [subsurface metagenome]